jgi:hypothetical protein
MRRTGLFALAITLTYVSVGAAQQYPIMDKVADKVIAKYQSSSCQQLYQQKQRHRAPKYSTQFSC